MVKTGYKLTILGRDFVKTILERLVADSLTFSSDRAKDE